MTAAILPFPTCRAVRQVTTLPTLAGFETRYRPLIRIAVEILEKEETMLRKQTRQMSEANALGLLRDVDEVLRDAATNFTLLADACRMAADRLADMVASTGPP